MAASDVALAARLRKALTPLSHPQHRTSLALVLNMGAQAAAGLLFWLVLTRLLRVDPAAIGVGYSVIALGTIAAVLAKGGLDTAILRHAPAAGRGHADALLRFATAIGGGVAVAVCLALAAVGAWRELGAAEWGLAAAIAVLLVAAWLQDALFLAEGRAGASAWRNLAASLARVALPLGLVVLAVPHLVATAWALSLAVAVAIGVAVQARLPRRDGPRPSRRAFLASATRNVAGGAAEFLPGLLLAPLVLATEGPTAAARFGMAWTIASMLFLASSAASRSALATLVGDPAGAPAAIRRAVAQHVAVLVPAAVLVVGLAPQMLAVFGPGYAADAALPLALLALSILAVAPATIYLALLRAQDKGRALVAYPVALLAALAVLAPLGAHAWGLPGVAAAWLAANLPFGLWAALRLHSHSKEVRTDGSPLVGRRAHAE